MGEDWNIRLRDFRGGFGKCQITYLPVSLGKSGKRKNLSSFITGKMLWCRLICPTATKSYKIDTRARVIPCLPKVLQVLPLAHPFPFFFHKPGSQDFNAGICATTP